MILNIFLALIFIRPFVSSLGYPSIEAYYCFSLIALSLVLLKSSKGTGRSFPGEGYLLLFFLAVIIATFFSLYLFKSLSELPKFLSYFFVFYVVYYAGAVEKKRILLCLILTAACLSLYAIYWHYIGSANLLKYIRQQKIAYPFAQQFIARHRAFMPYVLPSMLAGYLIMMLPVSLGCLAQEYGKNLRRLNLKGILLILPALSIATALLLTKSVGGLLSILLSFLIFVILRGSFNKRVLFLFSVLLLALICVFILRSYKAESFVTPAFSIQKRLIYWQQALSTILKHPFRGVGLGNLPFGQSKFAHNSYLQIWAEVGLLGIIGFLGLLYNSFKSIQLKRLGTDKLYAGLIIAYLAFLIHNFIDFSLFLPEISVFWWIILALVLSSEKIS